MTRAFRRLGSDRNSVAINKAVAEPVNAVPRPTVGDITNGQAVTLTWTEATQTVTQRVGSRAQYAIPTSVVTAGHYLENWSVSNGVLSVSLNTGSIGDAVSFWVF